MSAVLGIDISKRWFDVALREGDTYGHARFANTDGGFAELSAWLEDQRVDTVHACLEATGRYGLAVTHWLHAAGHKVSVVNPKLIKAFAQTTMTRSKSDRIDARLIADYCHLYHPPLWAPPEPARDRLRQLTRYRTSLHKQRQAERNRLQAGAIDPLLQQLLQTHLAFLDEQLAALEAEIRAHLRAHPDLRQQQALLESLPGIGPVSAALALAELPDIRRLTHPGQLVAYAGVDPRQQRSGSSVRKRTVISKQGNARLRTALYFPAMTAMTHSPALQPFVQRLRQAGLAPKAIILAVMRKLLRWMYGVLKHHRPFDPAYLLKQPSAA